MSTVGVFASIFDEAGRILLVKHGYGSHRWGTPGGRVEPGECPVDALVREAVEEIACEIRIAHLVGLYAKPYRDDLVLSFAATIALGIPRACPPEISDIRFFSKHSLPSELAFNTRIRIEDAFERCRGIVRVFDSADSLAPSQDTHAPSHTKA
jgi:8-oxo-dGTP diphosphatase